MDSYSYLPFAFTDNQDDDNNSENRRHQYSENKKFRFGERFENSYKKHDFCGLCLQYNDYVITAQWSIY